MQVIEMVNIELLTFLEISKYFMTYFLLFQSEYRQKKSRIILFYGISLIIQLPIALYLEHDVSEFVTILLGAVIPLYFVKGKLWERSLQFLLLVTGVSIVDVCGDIVLHTIISSWMNIQIPSTLGIVLDNGLSVITLIIIGLIRVFRKNKTYNKLELTASQYVVLAIGMVSCILVLSGTQALLIRKNMSVQEKDFWFLAIACASGSYLILSIYQVITYNKAERYRRKNAYYEEFITLQDNYTKHIIKSDQMVRQFRHDVHSHLTVIREYNNEGKQEEIEKYLQSIETNSGLYCKHKIVGNTAVDAIINDIINQANEAGITVDINGLVPQDISIQPYDLCIIISNLLMNALEACRKLTKLEKCIKLEVYSYENHLYICVRNGLEEKINVINGQLATTKEDTSQHGFGMLNVQQVVEKYHGQIDYCCYDNYFEIHILI